MYGKYDEYRANIDRSRLLGTCFRCGAQVTDFVIFRAARIPKSVKNAQNSVKELGTRTTVEGLKRHYPKR